MEPVDGCTAWTMVRIKLKDSTTAMCLGFCEVTLLLIRRACWTS